MTQQEMMQKAFGIVALRRQEGGHAGRSAAGGDPAKLPELEQLEPERTLAGLRAAQLSVRAARTAPQWMPRWPRPLHATPGREVLFVENSIDPAQLKPMFNSPICPGHGRHQ